MTIVELKNVTKAFGNKKVLDNFSLQIEHGTMVAITGYSGCGKSTLLNLIGLLENFDSGERYLDGQLITKVDSKEAMQLRRHFIGYIFQNFALLENETVEANLKIAGKYCKNKKKDLTQALGSVGLVEYEKRKVYELSGGEQQRLAIARLYLKACEVILADEPTGSLDKENSERIMAFLEKMHQAGKTVIIVTHDMAIAEKCQIHVNLSELKSEQ